MHYEIRKVMFQDFNDIRAIYASARAFMARTGNPNQWGKDHPPEETLRKNIQDGVLYAVCADGKIHGVFAFLLGEDPSYGEIDGAWLSSAPYGTIHRIASDGSRGIMAAALPFCKSICPHIRIDTHADNRVMQEHILKNGFRRCGIIHLRENGEPRIAYELLPEQTCTESENA